MHIHKFEKIWLIFGITTLILFLTTIGVSAFYMGNQPPSCAVTIDPERVYVTAPFDEPGLKKIGDNEYELIMIASAFHYEPSHVEIPLGATVHISVTTPDVVHGFQVAGTNINMMVEPGYVSTYTQTFNKEGEFLVLCNEYCGVGHHMMTSRFEVKKDVE
ncbi:MULTISPECIES: cytochrome c oxidase subunit II [Bacillus]|uniref:cytochrome c oxidase subunit II n=1 Tax=Bacillus TaxID=1386 RepID=UPI000BB723EC|nr:MULTISPECIES: cytochrome c oxidase subunit II [Bacillus]